MLPVLRPVGQCTLVLGVWLISWTASLAASGPSASLAGQALRTGPGASPYAAWKNGPSTDPHYFPIAVWLQDPKRADEYRAIGINTYVGLWEGPTEDQLAALKKAGIRVICDQNAVGMKHLNDPTIMGWMHGDEPDNYQGQPGGGYGPAIPPSAIIADYGKWRDEDPTRPIMLNLGQGVANDEWKGGYAPLSDYPEYMKGADIVSFDIYPMANSEFGSDWLWMVGKGVSRLVRWGRGEKVIWNALECTQIGEPGHKATPEQVRSEVWMSIIHGSMGIIYFVHQFQPNFIEAALLADPATRDAVKALNQEIAGLAPALNSPTVENGGTATSGNPLAPVDIMVKQLRGASRRSGKVRSSAPRGDTVYLFAVGMRNLPTHANLTCDALRRLRQNASVEVVGENRTVQAWGGRFEDDFTPYQVHIYKIALPLTGSS